MDTPMRLLTVPEVQERTQLSRSSVYKLLQSGDLESIKIGGARRIPEDALESYIRTLRIAS